MTQRLDFVSLNVSAVTSCFSLISCPFLRFENFRIHFNIDQVNFRPAPNYRQSDDQCIKAISAFFTSLNHYYKKKLNDRVTLKKPTQLFKLRIKS